MKPELKPLIFALVAMIVVVVFNLQIDSIKPVHPLAENLAAQALYVCPVASNFFDGFAAGIAPMVKYLPMFLLFMVLFIMLLAGYAFYQNLVKDKFVQKDFDNVKSMTYIVIFLGILGLLLVKTPNHYRTVYVDGLTTKFVLCEENDPKSRPVYSNKIIQNIPRNP